jgi:hypothetical protein
MTPWVAIEDFGKPLIGIPYSIPETEVAPFQEVTVFVMVFDMESPLENVTLLYAVNDSSSWTLVPMTFNISLKLYEAVIPGQPESTCVKYKIVAFDKVGNKAEQDNFGKYFTYVVIPENISVTVLFILMIFTSITLIFIKAKLKFPENSA